MLPEDGIIDFKSLIAYQDFSTLLLNTGPILCTATYACTNVKFKASASKLARNLCQAFSAKDKSNLSNKISPAEITTCTTVKDSVSIYQLSG